MGSCLYSKLNFFTNSEKNDVNHNYFQWKNWYGTGLHWCGLHQENVIFLAVFPSFCATLLHIEMVHNPQSYPEGSLQKRGTLSRNKV